MIISSSDVSDELESLRLFFEDDADVAIWPSLESELSDSSEDVGLDRFWPVFSTGSLSSSSSELKSVNLLIDYQIVKYSA